MKKIAAWLAGISIFLFVIDWSIMGIKLLDGRYDITLQTYLGVFFLAVAFVSIVYIRFCNRCPYCGKMIQPVWKYCPHCGNEIK